MDNANTFLINFIDYFRKYWTFGRYFSIKSIFRADIEPNPEATDPKYEADCFETILGSSGDTGNTFLIDLVAYFCK